MEEQKSQGKARRDSQWIPSGLEGSSCTLEAQGMSPLGSKGQEELECRNKQVTRNEEEFHVGFEGKSIVDTIMQSKMGHVKKQRRGVR